MTLPQPDETEWLRLGTQAGRFYPLPTASALQLRGRINAPSLQKYGKKRKDKQEFQVVLSLRSVPHIFAVFAS